MTCHRLSQVLYTGCPMLPADGMCKTIDNSLRYRKINAGTWWTSYWVPPVVKDMTLRWKLIRRTFHVSPVLSHAIMIHSLFPFVHGMRYRFNVLISFGSVSKGWKHLAWSTVVTADDTKDGLLAHPFHVTFFLPLSVRPPQAPERNRRCSGGGRRA